MKLAQGSGLKIFPAPFCSVGQVTTMAASSRPSDGREVWEGSL